jgi:hypothetical protein
MVAVPLKRSRGSVVQPAAVASPDARYAPPAPRSGAQPTAVVTDRR